MNNLYPCNTISTKLGSAYFIGVGDFCSVTKTRLFKYIEHFTTKTKSFQIKILIFFFFFFFTFLLKRKIVGTRSNEYTQSMVLSRNKKNNVYPCKPQFYCIKVGFKWVKLYRHVFVMKSVNGLPDRGTD